MSINRVNRRIVTALITAGIVLAAFIASNVSVHALGTQGRSERGEQRARRPRVPLPPLRQLDLTSTQRELVRGLVTQHHDSTRTAREQLAATRQALHDAVTTAIVDSGLIRSLASDLALLEGETAVQQAYLYAQIWQLLTPDQQTLAQQIKTEQRQQRELRRQRMQGQRGKRRR